MSDVTLSVDVMEHSQINFGSAPSQVDNFISPIDSRRLWLDFLTTNAKVTQSMTGGVVTWRNFHHVGQPVSAAHFRYHIKLCNISDNVSQRLYTGCQLQPWSDTQNIIGGLETELRQWAENLPDELNIQSDTVINTDPRAKLELAMYYHSVQMILHRPCLCEIKIDDQSQRSREFDHSCARACVHAAMSMLALMPDNPTAHEVYQLPPWWTMLHYICQSVVVIILELCMEAQHFPGEVPELTTYLRKGMAYLWCMTEGSGSAHKAWRILRRLLSDVATRYDDLAIGDIPEEAIPPRTWTESDKQLLADMSTVVPNVIDSCTKARSCTQQWNNDDRES